MDYRLPGPERRARRRARSCDASPEHARRLPHRVGHRARRSQEVLEAGAVACVTKDEDLDQLVARSCCEAAAS